MEVPRSVIDGYDEATRSAVKALQAELSASLSLIDYSAPIEQIRTEVVALMNAYCGAASDVGARLSSEFYSGLRKMVTGEAGAYSLYSGRNPRATERAVRAFVQKLVDGNEESIGEFEDLLLGRVDYEMKRSMARNTIDNARLDPDQPRFARVPQGEKTCDFCLMLASRGPVYLTAESAGALTKYHSGCDCKVIPFWGTVADGPSRRRGMSIEGYDPDALYKQYQERMEDPHSTFADRMAKGAETAKARRKHPEKYQGKQPQKAPREPGARTVGVPSGTAIERARKRTGGMSSEEYAEYKRELDAVRHRKRIPLPKAEYAHVMSEINTHLSDEDRKHALVRKAIGNYRYTFVNRGFDDYIIVGRTPIR